MVIRVMTFIMKCKCKEERHKEEFPLLCAVIMERRAGDSVYDIGVLFDEAT